MTCTAARPLNVVWAIETFLPSSRSALCAASGMANNTTSAARVMRRSIEPAKGLCPDIPAAPLGWLAVSLCRASRGQSELTVPEGIDREGQRGGHEPECPPDHQRRRDGAARERPGVAEGPDDVGLQVVGCEPPHAVGGAEEAYCDADRAHRASAAQQSALLHPPADERRTIEAQGHDAV